MTQQKKANSAISCKEIYEQPNALINTMEGRVLHNNVIVDAIGNGAAEILEKLNTFKSWLVVPHIMQE